MISFVQDIINMTKAMWHDWPVGRINCISLLVMTVLIVIFWWILFRTSRFYSEKEEFLCRIIDKKIKSVFAQTGLICIEISDQEYEVIVSKKDFDLLPEKGYVFATCVCGKIFHRIRHIKSLSPI